MRASSRARGARLLCLLAASIATAATLSACGGDSDTSSPISAGSPSTANAVFQVGTTTSDADLPAEPSLPTDAQVCSTLQASNTLVSRPDGSLPPEADPSVAGVGKAVSPTTANPDQARIQAALDACGAAVDAEVGASIAAADASATAAQKAAAIANMNIAGASGEELAKPAYHASKFAVRLVVNSGGGNSFISGPLTLPSGVTLWIDKGVTLYASRDVKAYSPALAGPYCANTAVSATKSGSSSNCLALLTGTNLVNSAVVGDGRIDGRGYAEIVTSDAKYPLMKVDLTCSNTYAAYKTGTVAPDGTSCDDGGTVVDSKSSVRNMSWWDLAYLGNMVQNGTTGTASQSNFRLMVFNYAKNLTLYRITLNNSPNFHVVPSGVDGLTIWGVKVQTPTLAAFANPAGNGNPLYTGQTFGEDNVKNTDAFDPGSASKATSVALSTGSTTNSAAGAISFDGYLKNFVFAYNYVSTGDDDIALKGSNNPSPAGSGLFGVDGNRNVRADRKSGIVIAHNHIYWGHGISIGSETNAGVTNVQVYDNSFWDSEEGLRIKSDYARGGEVSNINYANICIRDATNALLFTPYYSTKALPASGPLYPNFHDISISNVVITGSAGVKLQGFEANTGGFGEPAFPLVMKLTNVMADSPDNISVISSDAKLTLQNVNLPIFSSTANRVTVNGAANHALTSSGVLDCSKAFVDFPGIDQSNPFGTTWAPSL
ncbi:glycoside hydrolase family 28 protein [Burkholderia gladioli]|uniref:glycoside hydrolase family 28 protein n=1 Tax=Burkholderia gladioli TaxID=28095 RepID=UPI000649A972|nr:glycosyl hydrolase family 28 protein [Burkholderia gladioli]MDA0573792.1 glycosyl hydrolase family 28 protein [Burkholderia gladioli]MDA0602131.1 glycosyl hydrolase family 28 protein [Burkholderia gladioli]